MSPGSSSGSRLVKGALILLRSSSKGIITDTDVPPFVFQFNPETLKRVLLRSSSKGIISDLNTPSSFFQFNPERPTSTISSVNSKVPIQEFGKKPNRKSTVELISFVLELDVDDQLAQSNQPQDFVKYGLHPALATLESIMHSQTEKGSETPPVVLFLWGSNRLLPVWLDNMKIIEESFDSRLNPIRARIELSMRVLDFSDFKSGSLGYAAYASHLEKRGALTRLYGGKAFDLKFIKQLPSSLQKYLLIEKSESKKKSKKTHWIILTYLVFWMILTILAVTWGTRFDWPDNVHIDYGFPLVWSTQTLTMITGPVNLWTVDFTALIMNLTFWLGIMLTIISIMLNFLNKKT